MVYGAIAGAGIGIVSGIMQARAAEEQAQAQADAQFYAEQQQQNNANFRGGYVYIPAEPGDCPEECYAFISQ